MHGVIPESITESQQIIALTARVAADDVKPPAYPHAQIIALCQVVADQARELSELKQRLDATEERRRPGRPRKNPEE